MKLKTALTIALIIYGTGFFIGNKEIERTLGSGGGILSPIQGDSEGSSGIYDESKELGRKVDEFFCEKYKLEKDSTLCGDGDNLVDIGNRYGVSPTLLSAIAFRESTACKFPRSGNCWGFGYYSFDNYLDGAERVAEALSGRGRDGHFYKGLSEMGKLRRYNSVIPTYAEEVIGIKEGIEKQR